MDDVQHNTLDEDLVQQMQTMTLVHMNDGVLGDGLYGDGPMKEEDTGAILKNDVERMGPALIVVVAAANADDAIVELKENDEGNVGQLVDDDDVL